MGTPKTITFYDVYESSAELTEFKNVEHRRRNDNLPNMRGKRIPFDTMEVGQSFVIPMYDCNMPSLKVLLSNRKKKTEEDYIIYVHDKLGLVEVGRIG